MVDKIKQNPLVDWRKTLKVTDKGYKGYRQRQGKRGDTRNKG